MKTPVAKESFTVIFDLDGTLIDSQPGIIDSLKFALADSGFCHELSSTQVPVGPPLSELIQIFTNTNDLSTINPIISKFKFHYDSSGFRSSRLFDGVYGFLSSLYCAHLNLYIATNKRLAPTIKILNHLSIDCFFNDVYAVDSCERNYDSKASMLKALICNHCIDSNVLYLGDRYDDYSATVANSIPVTDS